MEEKEYVKQLQDAMRRRFGYASDEEECLAWLEVDATVDQAIAWINHGCGPGDFAGSSEKDPDVAWAVPDDENAEADAREGQYVAWEIIEGGNE